MIPTEILNLGAVSILFFLFLREFFAYLKTRRNGNGTYRKDITSVNAKLDNHLTEVNGKISDIETDIVEMKMDMKIIKNTLGDIKIKLQ